MEFYMEKFKISKSKNSNKPLTIRFPDDLYEQLEDIVNTANKGKTKRVVSLNGVVISAVKFALENLDTTDL
jgi:hypothetical protein